MKGRVLSINISKEKGTGKKPIEEGYCKQEYGFVGDAHSGHRYKQVSLISWENIEKENAISKEHNFKPGDFAENITTRDVNLKELKIGDEIKIGNKVRLVVTQIGKECPNYYEIYKRFGSYIMPEEGIFTKVLKGGKVRAGDVIEVNPIRYLSNGVKRK
ncbi:MAG: MOSC domain-containing protein [Candidatus Aerophobetes bacterium]|nr:MOSC domain-containing protein [Candidatus Aerophobetes bacterium]